MFDATIRAVSERRLPPGARMVEEELAEIFSISRARVRKVLLVLSQRRLVRLEPHRGAFVASPGADEARAALHARELLETDVVRALASLRRPERSRIVERLKAHLLEEEQALHDADGIGAVRLSGDFHVKLAEYAGNGIILSMVRDLVVLTSLAIANTPSRSLDCSLNEHRPLVQAIDRGDTDRATAIMREHLHHIRDTLLPATNASPASLKSVFSFGT